MTDKQLSDSNLVLVLTQGREIPVVYPARIAREHFGEVVGIKALPPDLQAQGAWALDAERLVRQEAVTNGRYVTFAELSALEERVKNLEDKPNEIPQKAD